MNRFRRWQTLGGFILGMQVASCALAPSPPPVTEVIPPTQSVAAPLIPLQKTGIPEIEGQLIPTPDSDQLTFKVRWPDPFRSQSLDFAKFRYLRLWVRGTDIPNTMMNQEGYKELVSLNTSVLTVKSVPKGINRVVTAQGYDIDKNPIPGATLKAYYSSPTNSESVSVKLAWRFVPAATLAEYLLDNFPDLAKTVDLSALQDRLNALIYGNQPAGGNNFAIHPMRLNFAALANSLVQNQGSLPVNAAANWVYPGNTVQVTVQNPQNGNFNTPIQVLVDDPASGLQSINAGNNSATLSNLAPGTWNIVALLNGLNGGVRVQTAITVSANGAVNPANVNLVLPPVITGLSESNFRRIPNLVSWWAADGDPEDRVNGNRGTVLNNTSFPAGQVGQAFSFDGTNDFVRVADAASLKPAQVTIAAWINAVSFNDYDGIILKSSNANWDDGYGLYPEAGNVYFFAGVWDQGRAGTAIPLGQWRHVAGTYDGITVRFYVDGQQQAANAYAGPFNHSLVPLTFGLEPSGLDWNGSLDEVLFFNRSLNAGEIRTLFNGRTLTLAGDGFDPVPANNAVTVNGTAVNVLAAAANGLTVTLPAGLFGQVPVSVTVAGKTSNNATLNIPPAVDTLNVSAAKPGEVVTLTGQGFDPTAAQNTVRFNGVATPVNAATNTSLTVTVPPAANTGLVSVTTAGGTGTSFKPFTVNAPLITNVSAFGGANPKVIALTGRNLDGATGVTFNGQAAAFNVVGSTAINATVPVGVTAGSLQVTTPQGAVVTPDNFIPVPLPGLMSWWTGDNTPNDAVGANHGTLIDNTTYAPGKVGQAFSFDGNGDKITVPSNATLQFGAAQSFTFSAWIQTPGGVDNNMIIGKTDLANEYLLFVRPPNGQLSPVFDDGPNRTEFNSLNVNDNVFHHVVSVRDKGTNFCSIYVDGALTTRFPDVTTGAVTGGNGDFQIGANGNGMYFNGLIDEVQLYNRALSTAEARALYDATK